MKKTSIYSLRAIFLHKIAQRIAEMSTTSTFLWLNNNQLRDIGFIACVSLRYNKSNITVQAYDTENKGFSSVIMKQLEKGNEIDN
jgi:hypothetical protein